MKLSGTIRSTEIWEHEGSGPTAEEAKDAAVEGIPEGFELVSVSTLPTKVSEAVRRNATARSTQTREIEAEGDSYDDAELKLRAKTPDGWILLNIRS